MIAQINQKLSPLSLENEFRLERAETDRRNLFFVLLLGVTFMAVLLGLTLYGGGEWETISSAVAIRALGILSGLVGLWKIRKRYDHARDEWVIFACGLAFVIHMVADNFRSNDFLHIAAWDIVSIFAIYTAVALSTSYQAILCGSLTAGSLFLWFQHALPEMPPHDAALIPLAYLAANCFGLVLSRNINRILRQQFLAQRKEKELTQSLEKTARELRSTISTRDRLFSVIAHDLRGPIGALGSTGAYLLTQSAQSDEKREKLIELICRAAASSYELLENLLNWALAETGELRTEIQPVSPRAIVEDNIHLLAANADRKQISIANHCANETQVLADPKMLSAIVRNLISNALKFTKPGGAITITEQNQSDSQTILTIRDTGVGIDAERLQSIFNLDYSAASSGTEGESGSSLGLRLCSQFIEKQRGRIWAESEPDQGSAFSFSLPTCPSA